MRRRIERSRARCEKAGTNQKQVKEEAADKQPKLAAFAPLENSEKRG
jgi:hypothetical protein